MSENVIIFQDRQSDLKENKTKSITKSKKDIDIFSKIFSEKFSFLILNHKHSIISKLKMTSIKRIMSKSNLKYNDYILLSFKNEHISIRGEKTIKEKEVSGEITEDEEENTVILKNEDSTRNQTLNENKKDIILDINNKKENIFDSDIPLLKDKINNTFSNIENLPKKYINLIILCNKVTINLDHLKCCYLILFLCGFFNLIYFFNITFYNIYIIAPYLENIYHFFCFPLGILLMVTGVYGYEKIKENIFDDDICLTLTHLSFITPLCSFALSRFNSEDNATKSIIMNFFINFISCFDSFFSIIILKEADRVNNCEKKILYNRK